MYTNTCSAVASDTEKGRIGRFLSVCTAQTSSNPFQDFLIEELQSLVVFLNTDTQTQVEQQQKPHMKLSGLYPLSLSPATLQAKKRPASCLWWEHIKYLYVYRHILQDVASLTRVEIVSAVEERWGGWGFLYIGLPDRTYQATGASVSITCTMEIAKRNIFECCFVDLVDLGKQVEHILYWALLHW